MTLVNTETGEVVDRLTDAESVRLGELEQVIHDGIEAFVEVGRALQEIQQSRLYREEHATFGDYCLKAWDLTRSYGYRLIAAAAIVDELSPIGDTPLPATESQSRALKDVQGSQAKAEVMRKASEGGIATAAKIRDAAAELDPAMKLRQEQEAARAKARAENASLENAAKDEADRAMATRIAERREHNPQVRAEHINQTVRGFLLSKAHDVLDFDPREAAEALTGGDEDAAMADVDRLLVWLETYRAAVTAVASVTELRSVK